MVAGFFIAHICTFFPFWEILTCLPETVFGKLYFNSWLSMDFFLLKVLKTATFY